MNVRLIQQLGIKKESKMLIRGGCLCSTVRYEVDKNFIEVEHCHCSMYRKVNGVSDPVGNVLEIWGEK